jgi:hypothetical protein
VNSKHSEIRDKFTFNTKSIEYNDRPDMAHVGLITSSIEWPKSFTRKRETPARRPGQIRGYGTGVWDRTCDAFAATYIGESRTRPLTFHDFIMFMRPRRLEQGYTREMADYSTLCPHHKQGSWNDPLHLPLRVPDSMMDPSFAEKIWKIRELEKRRRDILG